MEILFSVILFFLIILIFELVYSIIRKPGARKPGAMAERYSALDKQTEIDIFYNRKYSEVRLLDSIIAIIPGVSRLDTLMQQGGVKKLAGEFLLITVNISAIAFFVSLYLMKSHFFPVLIAFCGAAIPFFYLLYRRKKRCSKFEALFPDTLDLISYSLKAGYSILASFKLVAEEIADPVGEEFARVVEEINFGQDTDTALRNFSNRINSLELSFFVTSVIIQRDTGGNLIEVFEKISEIIRKKFSFREKVKTLSAEARLSANILLALPFLVGIVLFFINPSYIFVLLTDPSGPYLIFIAITMMSLGAFIIYRMVQLDV